MKLLFYFSIITLFLFAASCSIDSQSSVEGWNAGNTDNPTNNLNKMKVPMFTLRGKVWSPGADDPYIMAANRFPIPGALVAAYPYMPDPPSEKRFYCNKCVEVPGNIIHTTSDSDGSFELMLQPYSDYYIVVQKGLFRRVTYFHSGGFTEQLDLEPENPAVPKSDIVSLPNTHDPEHGMSIPRILVIVGRGELSMNVAYEAMGFIRHLDFDEIPDREAEYIASDVNELEKYNIIIATCGDEATYLTKPRVKAALRQYVKDGGKLFIDDFAYDWAEQAFPEFINFKVNRPYYPDKFHAGLCGTGNAAPDVVGQCNSNPCYDSAGTSPDPGLTDWLKIVDDHSFVNLKYACNVIYSVDKGVQGSCSNSDEDPHCINGEYIAKPKTWLEGSWDNYSDHPMTVSWNYYCGKVLYTVLHTHVGDDSLGGYKLLMQEKIMIYLLMELQTCTSDVVVE